MDQADWYLHEQVPTAAPRVERGDEYFACATAGLTLHVSSVWPTIEPGDFVLAQVVFENTASADNTTIPAGWHYYFWHPGYFSSGGNAYTRGPHCQWTGGFVESLGASFFIGHKTAGHRVCVRAWAFKNVDLRIPVDFMYVSLDHTSNIAYGGVGSHRGVPCAATRVHSYGGMQVSSGGVRSGGSRSTWWMEHLFGPTADYSALWNMKDMQTSASIFITNLVQMDSTSDAVVCYEETRSAVTGTASGGLRVWSGINASANWQSSSTGWAVGLQVFNGPTGSVPRQMFYDLPLDANTEYLFWASALNSESPVSYLGMKVTDPNGVARGNYFLWTGTPEVRIEGNIGDGFAFPMLITPDEDGLPSSMVGIVGGSFTASAAGTYTLAIYLLSETVDDTQARSDAHLCIGIGLNKAGHSAITPRVNKFDWRGISRVWLGSALWAPSQAIGVRGFLTFQLNRRMGGIIAPGLVGMMHPMLSPPGGVDAYRSEVKHSGGDTALNGVVRLDRWVFPRHYESNDSFSATAGNYYAEINTSNYYSFGTANEGMVGVMAPHEGVDGHGTDNALRWNQGAKVNSSGLFSSVSDSSASWRSDCVLGIQIDYQGGHVVFYKDGVEASKWAMGAIAQKSPFALMLSSARYVGDRSIRMVVNTSGPFSYKPAGAVAYDWINEVA